MRVSRLWLWAALSIGFAGCGGRAPEAAVVDTGAKAVVQDFCDAIVRQDWGRAYALLQPENSKQISLERFSRLAEAYRSNTGFDPQKVHIRSCEEQDSGAVAHVVFMGGTSHNRQQYKDGLTLRRVDGDWRIVLPQNFGRK